MEQTGNNKTEEITDGVLLITSQTQNEGDKAEPDERFFLDEKLFADEEEKPKEKQPKHSGTIFNKDMKKKIIKEQRKEKMRRLQEVLKQGIIGAKWIESAMNILNVMLNAFSVVVIGIIVVVTLRYFIIGNIFMSLVGCVLIIVSIYLNEKIN